MNNEEKLEKSTAVGSLTLFVSCYGINIYEVATHDSYTNYQDKLSFDSILVTSIVTGIIMTIVTWLVLTLYDCHKKAKEDDSVTTLELFKRDVFCKRTFIGLIILIIASLSPRHPPWWFAGQQCNPNKHTLFITLVQIG